MRRSACWWSMAVLLTAGPWMSDSTADEPAADILNRAEALSCGKEGRYDREAAQVLFEQAAATGDPAASFRLALILHFRSPPSEADRRRAQRLAADALEAVQKLASEGDPYARYLLGTAALEGVSVRRDLTQARHLLEQAAARDLPWAWHNLGWMVENGHGFDGPNPKAAIDTFRRASQAGNVASMVDFARLTLTADGTGALCDEGLAWLERSARAGHPNAVAFLGKLLYYGRGGCVTAAPAKALPWLEIAAEAGDQGAQYDLGFALVTGVGGGRGASRGEAMLLRALDQGESLAADTLALLYATGIGLQRDPARARAMLAEAARLGSDSLAVLTQKSVPGGAIRQLFEQGVERLEAGADQDPLAASMLASLYTFGHGVRYDPERAFELASQASRSGEASALRILAHSYRNGKGVARDDAEAVRWYRRCAEAGDSFCMMFYSQILRKGELVELDLDSGITWLVRSAEAGNYWAMGDLGHLYDEGWYGLPRDPERAAYWKRKRAALGDAEARGWLLYHGYDFE